VAYKLDGLDISIRDVLNLLHEIDQKSASMQVLKPTIDTAGAMGKMILPVLGMVSEMELPFIKQRQAEGIAAAKARGAYKGIPQSVDYDAILQWRHRGLVSQLLQLRWVAIVGQFTRLSQAFELYFFDVLIISYCEMF
jgi:DNA invertase Pin-like site-specific DNA recombinase